MGRTSIGMYLVGASIGLAGVSARIHRLYRAGRELAEAWTPDHLEEDPHRRQMFRLAADARGTERTIKGGFVAAVLLLVAGAALVLL